VGRRILCGGLLKKNLPIYNVASLPDYAVLNDTSCCEPTVLLVDILRQAHRAKYMVDQLKYVSLAESRRSCLVRVMGAAPVPDRFGDFDDPAKYCGAELSDHYMRDVWRMWFSALPVLEVDSVAWTREDYLHRVHQRWDGWILAGDASFKFAKIIRLGAKARGKRTRPVYGIFTVFNEYEQVRHFMYFDALLLCHR